MQELESGKMTLQGTSGLTNKKYKSNKLKFFIDKKAMILGKRGDGVLCPIALVASRVLGKPVRVCNGRIWYEGPTGNTAVIDLPLKARAFVHLFDQKITKIAALKPFSFAVDMGE